MMMEWLKFQHQLEMINEKGKEASVIVNTEQSENRNNGFSEEEQRKTNHWMERKLKMQKNLSTSAEFQLL